MGPERIRQAIQKVICRREDDAFAKIHQIPVSHILPNPAQPRKSFDDDSIFKLAESILRHGILQPLTVRRMEEIPRDDGSFGRNEVYLFELIAGERRLRAAKLAGLREVPCILWEADEKESAELALIENLQREDLGVFEQAQAIAVLIERHHLTQEEAAGILGLSQSAVANKLRLLRLTQAERRLITENGMGERHARALLKLTDPEQRLSILREAAKKSLNVAQIEAMVDQLLCPPDPPDREIKRSRGALKDLRIVFNTLDRAIDVIEKTGVAVSREKRENDDCVEVVIRIRKRPEPLLPCQPPLPLIEPSF